MTTSNDNTPVAAQLAHDIEAEQQATVASRQEIAQAVQATQSLQQSKHDSDLALLGRVRDRGVYLAEMRRQVERLERENVQHEMAIVSAIRGNIVSRAQNDADLLIMPTHDYR